MRMKLRKFLPGLSFLLALILTLQSKVSLVSAQQAKFKDIQGHWAQPCIEQLGQKRILNGYPDGTFKPNSPVTRAEFAAMVQTSFPDVPVVKTGGDFVDVAKNHWAINAIRGAFKTGFLSGYPGLVFQPNQNIPRVQALVALASGLKYNPLGKTEQVLQTAFSDAAAIPEYAKNGIAAAVEKQLVVNYPDVKSFNPNQLASRGEIAGFLCQALGISGAVPVSYVAQADKPPSPGTNSQEIRGVWITNIDSQVLFSRDNIATAVNRLSQMNFNTIYPTVWNWGYTLYPSKVAEKFLGRSVRLVTPLDEDISPDFGTEPGRDMLKEMIEIGHQKGMAVFPWFEFGFMMPADSEIVRLHPDWITNRRDGSQVWTEGIHDRVWLNPFHPEVQQFILDLVTEIVENYDLDGIQFDDHFGLPAEFGYDSYTVAMYEKEIKQKPSDNFNETFWVRWRADKLNAFMERLFQAVKARKQKCIVALSPNPLHYSLPAHLQDWFTWERKGWIEEIIVQVYRDDLDRFSAELEREEIRLAKSHIPVGVGILTGLKGRAVSLTQIQSQVQAARQRGLAGVSFFFYESLSKWATEAPADREGAFKQLFAVPVSRPSVVNNQSQT